MVEFTSNAGLYFKNDDVSFYVDALYSNPKPPYTKPSKEVIDFLFKTKVDYIFITHKHSDHYDKEMVNKYIQNNSSTIFVSPSFSKISGAFSLTGIELVIGNTTISSFETSHIGTNSRNCCYLINDNGIKYLVNGDSDALFKEYEKCPPCDYLITNPYFVSSNKGISIIRNIIKPQKIYVYHLFEGQQINEIKIENSLNCEVTFIYDTLKYE